MIGNVHINIYILILFVDLVTADSTQRDSECETVCFSDDSEVELFDITHRCSICKIVNAQCLNLAQACIYENDTDCVVIVNNIVWLRCNSCKRFFHLKCVQIKYSLSDLLEIVGQGYVCGACN